MGNQFFSVREQLFDIQFTNRSLVRELQNRVSRVANDRLMPAMNDCLERNIPDDLLLKFDSLTLDIGAIDYETLEEELVPRIVEVLEKELAQQLSAWKANDRPASDNSIVIINNAGRMGLLEYFLLNGTLPWWARHDAGFSVTDLLQELAAADAAGLRAMIIRIGQHEFVRKRMIFLLNQEGIRQLIKVLEPDEAAFILDYHKDLVQIQQKEQIVQAETAVFARATWLFILNYLLDDRASDFNRKSFIKSSLAQMAAWFNVDYFALLHLFFEAVIAEMPHDHRQSSLKLFIRELTVEEDFRHDQQALHQQAVLPDPEPSKDPLQLSAKADLLLYYLKHGVLPPGVNIYGPNALADMLADLVKQIPAAMRSLLQEMRPGEETAKRFFQLMGQSRGKELLHTLFPGAARTVLIFSSFIELIEGRKRLLSVEVDIFKQELLQLTAVLLFKEATENNMLSLLRSFVQRLKNSHGAEVGQLIVGMRESLEMEFRDGIVHSDLPALINILAEDLPIGIDPTDGTEQADVYGQAHGLLETLTYLVQFGNIPWWGREYFSTRTVDELFRELLLHTPEQAMRLLQFAGLDQRSQRRLIRYTAIPTLLEMFELFSLGSKPAATVKQAAVWINGGMMEPSVDFEAVARIMAQVAWDELIRQGYRDFSVAVFYHKAIPQLALRFDIASWRLATAINLGLKEDLLSGTIRRQDEIQMINNLVQVFSKEKVVFTPVKKQGLRKKSSAVPAAVARLQSDPFVVRVLAGLPSHEAGLFLKQVPARYVHGKPGSLEKLVLQSSAVVKEKASKEAMEIFRYFLVWGKLPDEMLIQGQRETNAFIKTIALLVFAVDPGMLVSLLKQTHLLQPAKLALTGILDTNKGGSEKKLAVLIDDLVTWHSNQTPGKISKQEATEQHDSRLRETVEALSAPGAVEKDGSFNEAAAALLENYFQTNTFPSQWRTIDGLAPDVLLKQLLLVLYQENRPMLQRLLQSQVHDISARIFVHDLVSEKAGGLEKELTLFLQPYKELYAQKLLHQSPYRQLERFFDQGDSRQQELLDQPGQPDHLVAVIRGFLKATSGKIDSPGADRVLRHAVVQLYTLDQPMLKRLLASDDHSATARLQLHDLFIAQTGYIEREVLKLLQGFWHSDLLALLASKQVAIDLSDPQELTDILLNLLRAGKKDQKSQELWQLAVSSASFIHYLLQHAGTTEIQTLVDKAGVGWGTRTADHMNDLAAFLEAAVPNKRELEKLLLLLTQFNTLFLSGRLVIKGPGDYIKAFFAYLLRMVHNVPVAVFSGIMEFLQQRKIPVANMLSGSTEMLQAELDHLIHHLDSSQQQRQEWSRRENALLEKKAKEQEQQNKTQQLEKIRKELEAEQKRKQEQLKKESDESPNDKHNKIYIRNAGLVLLHPFLGTYFSRLGLLDQGKFIDDASQQRAVLLLHYLAYGRTETEEFELALNKLLCGLQIKDAVPLEIVLTEEERTVSAELFAMIFERWEKMKNTSVEGFRASFLQREGALWREENDWKLRVEQRTYDLLLETLPWAFGMVKHAWMPQMLTVEWI